MNRVYESTEPTRVAVDELAGPAVIEFGTAWCGHCAAAQPLLEEAFASFPQTRHIKIADGRGHRLGRSFHVKLWPTLVFLKDGREVARLVRPENADLIVNALKQIE